MPIEIPISYDAHSTLYKTCLSAFIALGEQAARDNYMEIDNLRTRSARAEAAIRMMGWIAWRDARLLTIRASAEEVITVLTHLDEAARQRLGELLEDGSVKGNTEEIEGRGEIRVLAAPPEHLREVTHLIDVTNVCGELRRMAEGQRVDAARRTSRRRSSRRAAQGEEV